MVTEAKAVKAKELAFPAGFGKVFLPRPPYPGEGLARDTFDTDPLLLAHRLPSLVPLN
jgi:hypothetical protein